MKQALVFLHGALRCRDLLPDEGAAVKENVDAVETVQDLVMTVAAYKRLIDCFIQYNTIQPHG